MVKKIRYVDGRVPEQFFSVGAAYVVYFAKTGRLAKKDWAVK